MKQKVFLYIFMEDCINSRKLYDEVRSLNFNVMDTINEVLIYPTVARSRETYKKVLEICSGYGTCDLRNRGGEHENLL